LAIQIEGEGEEKEEEGEEREIEGDIICRETILPK
jgi:hypothetical protein